MSLGFLWGLGNECGVCVAVEGSASVPSKAEQVTWVAVGCEGTKLEVLCKCLLIGKG